MSVDIEKLIREDGLNPKEYVTDERWPCSVFYQASALRGIGLQVGFDPRKENPYHGAVWGISSKGQKNRLLNLVPAFLKA
jgi:hypothetical protein